MRATIELGDAEILAALKDYLRKHGWDASKVELRIDPGYEDGPGRSTPPSCRAVAVVEEAKSPRANSQADSIWNGER